MLVEGVNDSRDSIVSLAEYLSQLKPHKAYLAIPTRPPAETDVKAPDDSVIFRAYQLMKEKLVNVEYLIDYEGDTFASTGGVEHDLLAITAVHPMREQAVKMLLTKAGVEWNLIQRLLTEKNSSRLNMTASVFMLDAYIIKQPDSMSSRYGAGDYESLFFLAFFSSNSW